MVEVAPAGVLSKPLDNLRTLIAESAAFQTWVGAANATEALASIYLIEGPATSADRPIAIIGPGDNFGMDSIAGGVVNQYSHSGSVQLWLEDDVGSALNEPDAYFTFVNTIGSIIADIINPTDTDNLVLYTRIELHDGPFRTAVEDRRADVDTMGIALNFTWQAG